MNGFLHYFLAPFDPMSNLGFSRAVVEVIAAGPPSWWLLFPLLSTQLPAVICWLVYLFNPALIRPHPPARRHQAEPLVSVVIAGRNESGNIGHCIRSALLCGYANLEVIFVDDHSNDDSVAIARRAALSVSRSSRDVERVRVFPSPRRNGKASSLNIGIRMARGEFIVIHDADSVIQYGAIQHWLLPFADPRVGAVSANIRVLNSTANLLTRLQEIEYAMKCTLRRYYVARVQLLNIITGMGGMFRGEILRRLGGFDTGLGDDTDMSTLIRKQRWRLAFSFDAVVWTTVPATRRHLWSQRMRWRRNIVKILISKHRDRFLLGRYGLSNAILVIQLIALLVTPWTVLIGLAIILAEEGPLTVPELLRSAYWVFVLSMLIKMLIAQDIARTPQFSNFWLALFYPFYFLFLLFPVKYAELCEFVRIGTKHPYVPDHVWQEIPWW